MPERKGTIRRFVIVGSERYLFQIVDALGATGGLTGRLHGGEQ
jgi:hypothetical protein